jgi:hypothetical protein
VYIRARIQANLLNRTLDETKPFSGFFKGFLYALFTEGGLHKQTFLFLLNYKKKDWPEIDNTPINNALKYLTALTTFLKPYMLVALIFWVLRIWIDSHFLYNPLQITLGEIQQKLFFIRSFTWMESFIHYKPVWFAVIGVTLIGLMSIAKSEKFQKKIKKSYSYGFALLSILLNVSFFGMGAAGPVSQQHTKLISLKIEIIKVHNQIYTNATEAVIAPLIDHYFEDAHTFYDVESNQLEKDASLSNAASYDSAVITPYFTDIALRIEAYKFEYSLDFCGGDQLPPSDKAYLTDPILPTSGESWDAASYKTDAGSGLEVDPGFGAIQFSKGTRPPATVIHEEYQQHFEKSEPVEDYDAYVGNKDNWNLTRGRNILADIKMVRDSVVSTSKLPASKMEQLLALSISCFVEIGVDKLFDIMDLKPLKFLKKMTSSWADVYTKDCIVKATVTLIGKVSGFFKKGTPAAICDVAILSEKDKQDIRQNDKQWLTDRKSALERSNQQLIAANNRLKEQAREERRRQAAEEENRLARIREAHRQFAGLERQIKDLIHSKSLGIPYKYSDRATDYLRNNSQDSRIWNDAIDRMTNNDTYDPSLSMRDNIEATLAAIQAAEQRRIREQLKQYLVPAEPVGTVAEYGLLLQRNYDLVARSGTLADISKAVSNRDNPGGAGRVIAAVCGCCGLPLTFPVCSCRL